MSLFGVLFWKRTFFYFNFLFVSRPACTVFRAQPSLGMVASSSVFRAGVLVWIGF